MRSLSGEGGGGELLPSCLFCHSFSLGNLSEKIDGFRVREEWGSSCNPGWNLVNQAAHEKKRFKEKGKVFYKNDLKYYIIRLPEKESI